MATLEEGITVALGMAQRRLDWPRAVLERAVEEGAFPGYVALVMWRGETVLQVAGGQAEIEPNPRPMRQDTIFDLASVTKVVAGSAAAHLAIERGYLSLDDRVQDWLPEYQGLGKSDTLIWHLMTHTSGLPLVPELHHDFSTAAELRQAIFRQTLLAAPGTHYQYTCLGYHLLADIIEKAVGRPVDRFLHDELYGPLGMNDTLFRPEGEKVERCAATEFCKWRGRVIRGEVHDENCYVLGGVSLNAGLFSTAADVARYGQMLLNDGELDGVRIFSPSTVQAMFRNRTPHLAVSRSAGWGISLPEFGDIIGPGSLGHTGFTGTSILLRPDLGLLVVLLTNRVHPSRWNYQIDGVRRRFHNAVGAALCC